MAKMSDKEIDKLFESMDSKTLAKAMNSGTRPPKKNASAKKKVVKKK